MGYKNAAAANAVWYSLKKKPRLDSTIVVNKGKTGTKKRGIDEVKVEEDEGDVEGGKAKKAKKLKKAEGVFVKREQDFEDDGVYGDSLFDSMDEPDFNLDVSDFQNQDGEVPVEVETECLRAQFRTDHAELYPERMVQVTGDGVDETHVDGEDCDEEVMVCRDGEVKAEAGVKFEDVEFENPQKAELGDWDSEAEALGAEWIFHGAAEYLIEACAKES